MSGLCINMLLRLLDAQLSPGSSYGTFKFFVHARWRHRRTVPRGHRVNTFLSRSVFRFLVLMLDNVKFCASFLKALVKDFGLNFDISNV